MEKDFFALGMAMELLITASGTMFARETLKSYPPISLMAKAPKNEKASMGKSATANDFFTSESFDLFSSSSREPSSTINISPMVPSIGNACVRFGICISKLSEACFTIHPSNNNKMTEGIFVNDDVISNKYAKSTSTQSVMITATVIDNYFVETIHSYSDALKIKLNDLIDANEDVKSNHIKKSHSIVSGIFCYRADAGKGISRFSISSLLAISHAVAKIILTLFSYNAQLILSTVSVGLW